jgi:hypothetical protein
VKYGALSMMIPSAMSNHPNHSTERAARLWRSGISRRPNISPNVGMGMGLV